MEELLKVLVQQAFTSQNERIEELKKEIQLLRKDKDAQDEQIKDLIELNKLFDNAVTEMKDYIKSYITQDDETNLMEEYKFGEQRKQ
jgi:hypothetical protein